jgi:hypothetical protein
LVYDGDPSEGDLARLTEGVTAESD